MPMSYPKSEAEWLALRHENVSSTESAALFGLAPYHTAFELATMKKEKHPATFEQNERMKWGLRLQEAIAKGISEDYGVKVRRVTGYAIHPDIRLGASFDYEIVGIRTDEVGNAVEVEDIMLQQMYRDLGPGVLEVKNVDNYIFKQDWKADEDTGEVEAPPHFEIQVQHQLAAIQTRKWSAIAVLIGGNRTFLVLRDKDDEFVARLESTVNQFWIDLEAGKMPPVTLPADIALLRQLYLASSPGKLYDGTEDTELLALVTSYRDASEMAKHHEEARKSMGVQILMRIGDSEAAVVPGFKISASTTSAAQIPAYTRAAFRNMRITPIKTAAEKKGKGK